MNRHLTSEEISAAIAGLEDRCAQAHLSECRVCRAEVEQFRTDLQVFGAAIHDWSGRQPRAATVRERGLWPVAAYAAMLLILLAIGLTRFHRDAAPIAKLHNTPSDALLLQEVSTELSRTVPGPLEPLLSGPETSPATAQ